MKAKTNSQKMAQAAWQRIAQQSVTKEFKGFAREFPSLVHSCGLAQAVAFALAKGGHQEKYLSDLAAVLRASAHPGLIDVDKLGAATRDGSLTTYIRLSRDALRAAQWLKRYVEAKGEK